MAVVSSTLGIRKGLSVLAFYSGDMADAATVFLDTLNQTRIETNIFMEALRFCEYAFLSIPML